MSGQSRASRIRDLVSSARRGPAPAGTPVDSPPGTAEQLLLDSALFDERWWARHAGRLDSEGQGPDRPTAVRDYLAAGDFETPTHPLFDTAAYVTAHPESLSHPAGPVGHYEQTGAAAGHPANDWLGAADLRAWIAERRQEWRVRRRAAPRVWSETAPAPGPEPVRPPATPQVRPDHPTVSVVVRAGSHPDHLATTLRSLVGQTLTDWEALVVVAPGAPDAMPAVAHAELADRDVIVVEAARAVDGLAGAVDRARGGHVAFLDAGDTWPEERLRLLVGTAQERGAGAVADALEGIAATRPTLYAAHGHPPDGVTTRAAVDLARLLVRRDLLGELGGFDTGLPGGWAFDLVLRLSRVAPVETVPVVGVRRDFRAHAAAARPPVAEARPVEPDDVESWADVVLNGALIDWPALADRPQEAATVSVVIPTYDDWELTLDAVRSVAASHRPGEPGEVDVDCVVWDNGSSAEVSIVLDSLPERFAGVRVLHSPVNLGFALGNNLAVPHLRGATVVFLNNDTTVPPGWLEPVREALADPDVLGAQPLLVYPTGAVQSAGVAFPSTGGLPHAFLQGFPVEDAAGVDELRFHALTGAALALRFSDVVALRGFDPLFTNGMEDVDLCRRLAGLRAGHFRVLPQAPVVHYESRTPGRYDKYARNRLLYLDRWHGADEPRDDVELWATRGFRVVDHQIDRAPRRRGSGPEPRLAVPLPVLVREGRLPDRLSGRLSGRLSVEESAPALRWAIKNPAPAGGERWGDTHFARALAGALRELGQEVVIDHRPEFERATGRHDDVALVLRGLVPYRPSPENVSLCWVISHPELIGPAEAAAYDRVLAASVSWSAHASAAWGTTVEPLLQATDPALFHPGLAEPDTGERVLFVGSSRGEYRPVVRAAVESGLPLTVHGAGWQGLLPDAMVSSRFLDNTRLGAAYASAGVVLNDHHAGMRDQGFVSNRLFDAVAAGARVISDDVGGVLADLFGASVQVWRTPQDLARLATGEDLDAVFGDSSARRAVAERVAREHSFHARAARLVEVAVEERARRGFSVSL